MSGRDKTAEKQQQQLAAQQMQLMKEQSAQAQQRMAYMDELQKPLIDYSKMAITNPLQLMKGTMGGMFDIDKQFQAGKQAIMDTVPEGAARDTALAQLSATAPQMRGQALNQAYMQGLNTLAGMGGQSGTFGLQQLGAGMRFGEDAGQTNNSLMQAAAQRKAATMGAIGQVAGIAGSMFGGGFGGGGAKTGGASIASSPMGPSFSGSPETLKYLNPYNTVPTQTLPSWLKPKF